MNTTKPALIAAALALSPTAVPASPFYDYEVLARTGDTTPASDTLTGLRGQASVNESGKVVFMADATNSFGGADRVLVLATAPGALARLSQSTDNRSMGFPQITADNRVAVWEGRLGNTLIRIHDADSPGSSTLLTSTTTNGMDFINGPPTISDSGAVYFAGGFPRAIYCNTSGISTDNVAVASVPTTFAQPWAGGDALVVRDGRQGFGTLKAILPDGTATLATDGADGWGAVGEYPGLSETGKVVAFAAVAAATDGEPASQGIFISAFDPLNPELAGPQWLVSQDDPATGLGAVAGDDDSGADNRVFSSIALDQRVSVIHREAGPDGLEGDDIIVSFFAQTDAGGPPNPHQGDAPMLYTGEPGLWTIHVRPGKGLGGTGPLTYTDRSSPIPVAQVGDRIAGAEVTSIAVHDPLAFSLRATDNTPRPAVGRCDHFVAFEATTTAGAMVVRATMQDTDDDGLFDHWERTGGGIDIDADGLVDLDLAAMGATPDRKDLFLEIDWLAPWFPEDFTDTNDNGVFDPREPFEDLDGDGRRDEEEPYEDTDGDGERFPGDPFTDTNSNGVWDDAEIFTDTNANGVYDVAEPYEDTNSNGGFDDGEPFTDTNRNGRYDFAETLIDTNGNGRFDPAEPYTDTGGDGSYTPPEPFEDTDGDGRFDARDEPFSDDDGDGEWDAGEPWDDRNGDGEYNWATYHPDAAALGFLDDVFASAPLPNPDGTTGARLHIDAGPGRSIAMGAGPLQGGDPVTSPDGGHIHVVYGGNFVEPVPERSDDYDHPWTEVPYFLLKRQFFGAPDKNARELAFRYLFIGDRIRFGETGALGMTESPLLDTLADPDFAREPYLDTDGDGEFSPGDRFIDCDGDGVFSVGDRLFDLDDDGVFDPPDTFTDIDRNGIREEDHLLDYRLLPGNDIMLGFQGRRRSQDGGLKVPGPRPDGTPMTVPEPDGFLHGQVILHEIGHALGLQHGGWDDVTLLNRPTPKPDFVSVMNYGYTEYPREDGTLVRSFSSESGPGTFDEWASVRLGFNRNFDVIGFHRSQPRAFAGGGDSGRDSLADAAPGHGLTLSDLEAGHGPFAGDGPLPDPVPVEPIPPDLRDDDGDGIPFLLEEALGLDANSPDSGDLPLVPGVVELGGNPQGTLTYPRNTSLADISYQAELSTDLVTWSSDGVTEEIVSTDGPIETVRAIAPAAGSEIFLRLSVRRTP